METFSDAVVIDLLNELHEPVAAEIATALRKTAALRDRVSVWWVEVGAQYPGETAPRALARLALLNWIVKLLLAHYLKASRSDAAAVEAFDQHTTPRQALKAFEAISRSCDFWTVFQPALAQEHVSDGAWTALLQVNFLLSDLLPRGVEQALLGRMLEETVQASQRKTSGQYVTPERLAQLLIALAVDNLEAAIWDPFCGSGTIARVVMEAKRSAGVSDADAAAGVWLNDIDAFAVQIATIAVSSPRKLGHLVRVFRKNTLTIAPGSRVEFQDPQTGAAVTEALPSFAAVVTNPPFIRFESLPDLRDMLVQVSQSASRAAGIDELDVKSDFMAFVPFLLWEHIKSGGRLGMIVTNAWLATGWGARFRRLLRRFYSIDDVVISASGRWFENADIVTNLLVMTRREQVRSADDLAETIRFTALHRRLADIRDVESLVSRIRTSGAGMNDFVSHHRSAEDIKRLEVLGLSWQGMFVALGWLDELGRRLVPASEHFDINRGERRGWNPLFYPETGHGIERQYIRPALRSPTDVTGFVAAGTSDAFCCSRTLAELRNAGHTGALAWIRKFAGGVNEKGRPLRQSLARRGYQWYEMRPDTLADLVMSINPARQALLDLFSIRAAVRVDPSGIDAPNSGTTASGPG